MLAPTSKRRVKALKKACAAMNNAQLVNIITELYDETVLLRTEVRALETKYNAHCANATSHASADTTNNIATVLAATGSIDIGDAKDV